MNEVLAVIADVAVPVFVVACLAAAGLGLDLSSVVAPLRRPGFTLPALAVNFVFAPAAAFALGRWLSLEPSHAAGLILLGAAAGAPFLPKLAELADGDVSCSVGLMVLLTLGSAVLMPVALPLLMPGLSADPWAILKPILFSMLLPLAAAMAFRNVRPVAAAWVRPFVATVSNVAMLAAVVALIALNGRAMLGTLGSGAILAALVFTLVVLAAGWACGGSDPRVRSVMALGSAQRNVAAALIVAVQSFSDPQVAIMLLVATFAGMFVILPAAKCFASKRRAAS